MQAQHAFTRAFVPKHAPPTEYDIRGLQRFVDDFRKFFVITGAGVSTESGIPDYRSKEVGRFERSNHRPITIQEFMRSEKSRQRY